MLTCARCGFARESPDLTCSRCTIRDERQKITRSRRSGRLALLVAGIFLTVAGLLMTGYFLFLFDTSKGDLLHNSSLDTKHAGTIIGVIVICGGGCLILYCRGLRMLRASAGQPAQPPSAVRCLDCGGEMLETDEDCLACASADEEADELYTEARRVGRLMFGVFLMICGILIIVYNLLPVAGPLASKTVDVIRGADLYDPTNNLELDTAAYVSGAVGLAGIITGGLLLFYNRRS